MPQINTSHLCVVASVVNFLFPSILHCLHYANLTFHEDHFLFFKTKEIINEGTSQAEKNLQVTVTQTSPTHLGGVDTTYTSPG